MWKCLSALSTRSGAFSVNVIVKSSRRFVASSILYCVVAANGERKHLLTLAGFICSSTTDNTMCKCNGWTKTSCSLVFCYYLGVNIWFLTLSSLMFLSHFTYIIDISSKDIILQSCLKYLLLICRKPINLFQYICLRNRKSTLVRKGLRILPSKSDEK